MTVNTAFESRRWEYDLSAKVPATAELIALKSLIVDTVNKVEGVLADPPPEALVIDLGAPDSDTVKLHITWWAKSSRHQQMMGSEDRVLSAIRKALQRQ